MKRTQKTRGGRESGVLADSNFVEDYVQNSSSDEEVIKRNKLVQRRKSFIEQDKGRQRASLMETPRGEKRKSRVSGSVSGEGSSDEDRGSDFENHANRSKRVRRRLSKKRDDGRHSTSALNISYGNLNSSMASPTVGSPKKPTDKKTLQEIYSTCSYLFQTHKITPQNAFSLRLVECLDEIIQSEDFDRKNLPLLARTLEIGGRIYVCRVDCTHAHTIKLATEIAANQNDDAGATPDGDNEPQELQDVGEDERGRKKIRARVKKRSRFIEDTETKLNTRFEDQSTKYASRRTTLKIKLHRNIDEELDFDYLSYFLKPGQKHPIETEEEYAALPNGGKIPDSHVNEDEIKDVPWHPFNVLDEWNPTQTDIWGIPLASACPLDLSGIQQQLPCEANEDGFAYNPENRPDEYPAPEIDHNDEGCDHNGFADDNYDDASPAENLNGLNFSKPIAVDNLRSLDDLKRFFISLKGAQLVLKNKYGWAGPVFLKPHRSDVKKKTADMKSSRKPRKQKTMFLNYDEVDWKDPTNKYIDGGSRTTFDDKVFSKWATMKTITPYCTSHNFLGYDEDEEDYRNPFDAVDGQDDPMANIIRFFIDSNRNIFKLLEEEFKGGKDVLSHSVLVARQEQEDEAGVDMDIEAPRDFADDSFGNMLVQPDAEIAGEGGSNDFAVAGMNLTAMFPGTLGFDNDPMSRASEFDSIKFSKQPKPIDMHALKVVIRKILTEKLLVDDEGKPTTDEDQKLDLMSLITEMLKRVDSRMAKHMSMAIIIVGLMHVVADHKFFMVPEIGTGSSDNPYVVCRGRTWKHKDHIPMSSSEDT